MEGSRGKGDRRSDNTETVAAPQILRARRRPVDLARLGGHGNGAETESGEAKSPDWLRGKRVGMIAGIGRPESLRRTLEDLGASVVREMIFPDHHAYQEQDLRTLRASTTLEVDAWITTEKDALKILPRWLAGVRVLVLRIEAVFEEEGELPDRVLEVLRERGRLPASVASRAEGADADA